MNEIQPESSPGFSKAFYLTVGLIGVAILGNAVVPNFFLRPSPPISDIFEAVFCAAIGVLVAQPCLLATWAILGTGSSVIRIAISMGVLCLFTIVYLASLALLGRGDLPIEVTLIVFGISFGLYFLAAIPMRLFRWNSKHVLSNQHVKDEVSQPIQFGIRHIFVLMTVTAILIPIAKTLFDNSSSEPGGPWLEISVFISLYSLLAWGAFLFAVACVFAPRPTSYFIALVVFLVTIPALVAMTMSFFFTSFQPFEISNCIKGTCFAACFSFTMIGVLSMYRSIGYRLRPI